MSSMPDEGVVSEVNRFPGESLLVAREAKGVSQKNIAEELNLPVRYIQWIEEGAFEKLPSLVFAKGYIRSYAKALGLESEPLVSMFDQIYGVEKRVQPIQSVSKVEQQVKLSDPVMRWSGWLFLLLLVAAVVWWWQTQFSLPTPAAATESNVATSEQEPLVDGNKLRLPTLSETEAPAELEVAPEPVDGQEDEPQNLSDDQIKALQAEIDKPAVATESEVSEPSETSEPEAAAPVSEPAEASQPTPNTDGLAMVFSGESWVTLKDATGRTLVNKAKRSGETLNISGAAPLTLVIGRASSVEKISYNGAKVELTRYIKGNVAKLSLPSN